MNASACLNVRKLSDWDNCRGASPGYEATECGEKTCGRHVGDDLKVHGASYHACEEADVNFLHTAIFYPYMKRPGEVQSHLTERKRRVWFTPACNSDSWVRRTMSAAIVPSLESSNGVCDTTATPRWSVGHQRAGVLPYPQTGRVKRLDYPSATPWNQLQFCQSGKFRFGLLSSTSSLRLAAPGARVYYLFAHLRVFSVGPPISLRWHRGVQHNSRSSFRVRSPDFFRSENDIQHWPFTLRLLQPVGPIPPQVVFQECSQSTTSTVDLLGCPLLERTSIG
ncbi:hypothetical protein T08_11754 [Trichinella sp. T8]|nr:hypothetical protein T08_11754 [Trichinella sp. T8]